MAELQSPELLGHSLTPDEGSPQAFDEMVAPDGTIRGHWQSFVRQLVSLGLPDVRNRWEDAKHLIRENGVTYNVYGDPRGMERPWELDPIPLLVSSQDASWIEHGLTQRARLLELILADLYGPQRALAEGYLPPPLLYGHPGFLRACQGIEPLGNRRLLLYAADVGRSPDGIFRVISDRAQAPSGLGYALENRIVLTRMMPEIFRECRVQRLALFFQSLRQTLASIAPYDRDNPRIVLLTPGPYNETYFEHAYLARYLGYTLVEGNDLTVRDNRVYLKLLGGLQPVDVILRRLDDDYCDPLELRRDSFLGVPGLVQAVRAGNVAVANSLGSGLVESPALLAYLPGLCRFFLGEDLRLPSIATWWCGEESGLSYVLANLSRMIVRPACRSGLVEPIFGERLTRDELVALSDRIRRRPLDFVGQEQISLSTAPGLDDSGFQPKQVAVRWFLAATGNGFTMMPGGLSRITSSADSLVVSMQRGGGSKDTWLLSDGPVSTFSLLSPKVQVVKLSRGGGDLPSRVADDLFWLGRYVERVEGTIRLLRVILIRMTDQTGLTEAPELPALLRSLTYQTMSTPGFIGAGAAERLATPEAELLSLIGDPSRTTSLKATIHSLHHLAGKVRDRFSIDLWRILIGLDLDTDEDDFHRYDGGREWPPFVSSGQKAPRLLSEIRDILDDKILRLAAFSGLVAESMTRGQGWRFLDMGRRLERSLRGVGQIRSTLTTVTGPEDSLLEALLQVADSSMTYRRRYMSQLQTAPVLDLLLADETNPRSVAFQLLALAESLEQLPRGDSTHDPKLDYKIAIAALDRVRNADPDMLASVDPRGSRAGLDGLLSTLESEIPDISDHLSRSYFSHLYPSRHSMKTVGFHHYVL
ncbi:circularly permuted type 2 ATP-grasp protein [Singulisphaera sp. PoT]|uniref:circularly permuted type 2 ATP-grasp protein n=1 Tax=Singulisphaera sp. PoT TaxID=3411797 RepID=UPI003BF55933